MRRMMFDLEVGRVFHFGPGFGVGIGSASEVGKKRKRQGEGSIGVGWKVRVWTGWIMS